jgi:hypothetical protein
MTLVCPACRATDVDVDLARSVFEQKLLRCRACGLEEYADAYEIDDRWRGAAAFGCARCAGDDAAVAWQATRARERSLVQESHFGVHVARCACGQRFVEVFLERIDWVHGDDDQTWLLAPIGDDDVARLLAADEADVPRVATDAARDRRFVVRGWTKDGAVACWWRDGGFAIGPHD